MDKIGTIQALELIKLTSDSDMIKIPKDRTLKEDIETAEYYVKGKRVKCVYKNSDGIMAIGYASCHPDDVFNMSYGCALAEVRARKKFFEKIEKRLIEGNI